MARAPYNGKMTFIILKDFCYLGFSVVTISLYFYFFASISPIFSKYDYNK